MLVFMPRSTLCPNTFYMNDNGFCEFGIELASCTCVLHLFSSAIMGTCFSREVALRNGGPNWQVLLFGTEPYSTLVCHEFSFTVEWGILAVTCRAGMKLRRQFSLATLSIEKDRRRAIAQDLNTMLDHFNLATEIFLEDDEEGRVFVGFEFQTASEANRFCDDVIDFQRRRDNGVI